MNPIIGQVVKIEDVQFPNDRPRDNQGGEPMAENQTLQSALTDLGKRMQTEDRPNGPAMERAATLLERITALRTKLEDRAWVIEQAESSLQAALDEWGDALEMPAGQDRAKTLQEHWDRAAETMLNASDLIDTDTSG